MNPKISIAIPAYIKDTSQIIFLENLFDSILEQTFADYEVVVADHSTVHGVEKICEDYSGKMNIVYLKNFYGRGIPTENANCSLKYCSGEYIKILHMDDFFVNPQALEKIVNALDSSDKKWLVNGFNHTYDGISFFDEKIPQYPEHLLLGYNLLGGPSNITIRNDCKLDFDINITLNIDVDYYHRMRMNYGMPFILNDILVTSRIRNDRVSAQISSQQDITIEADGCSWGNIQSEIDYIKNKHNNFFENWEYPNG
jgi:glycosyltransferase involved in cell wall biosynthesis